MAERRRILVLETPGRRREDSVEQCLNDCELVHVNDLARGVARLRSEKFDGVWIDSTDPLLSQGAVGLLQANQILETLADGVAAIRPDLRILWANAKFKSWCDGSAEGRNVYEALGSPQILGPDYGPACTALAGRPGITRLYCRDNRYLEMHFTPVNESDNQITQLIALGRDVSAAMQQQQKFDALHRAGEALSALSPDQLAEMGPEERIDLLKANICRFTHDLLHYDVIEVRLLDPQTNRLEPLLDVGMSPDASKRVLFAEEEDNGVTGFVAATGKSYLCVDTTHDPLFIEGSPNARSSLTVPLICQDQVIGTFNVESPRPNAFDEDDLKFAEIFSREIADALHTLELLSAQRRSSATQSIEAISREVALPVDEILTAATAILDGYIGHDPDMAERLRQVLQSARSIKQCIQKVGEHIAPSPAAGGSADDHPRLKGMRILVADNDERVRRTAHNILGRWGCVVETARDGREAVTMARLGNSTYDAILADIRLPDLGGYEVYRRLIDAQPQAKVILMTAYGYDPSHSIVKARQEGLRSVLCKPFRVDQLLEALEPADSLATRG